jgi:hypothetical protein
MNSSATVSLLTETSLVRSDWLVSLLIGWLESMLVRKKTDKWLYKLIGLLVDLLSV